MLINIGSGPSSDFSSAIEPNPEEILEFTALFALQFPADNTPSEPARKVDAAAQPAMSGVSESVWSTAFRRLDSAPSEDRLNTEPQTDFSESVWSTAFRRLDAAPSEDHLNTEPQTDFSESVWSTAFRRLDAAPSGDRLNAELQTRSRDVSSAQPEINRVPEGAVLWKPDSRTAMSGTPFAASPITGVMDPHQVADQMAEPVYAASELLPDGESHTLRLKLRPAELGQVDVEINRDAAGRLNAHLTVEHEQAGRVLNDALGNLREALEQAGLQVGELGVSTGHSPGWNPHGQAHHPGDRQLMHGADPDAVPPLSTINGDAAAARDRLLNLHA
ncbi:MAG: flagellar hook-length control protein FliK [Blastocatellia bacterium]